FDARNVGAGERQARSNLLRRRGHVHKFLQPVVSDFHALVPVQMPEVHVCKKIHPCKNFPFVSVGKDHRSHKHVFGAAEIEERSLDSAPTSFVGAESRDDSSATSEHSSSITGTGAESAHRSGKTPGYHQCRT